MSFAQLAYCVWVLLGPFPAAEQLSAAWAHFNGAAERVSRYLALSLLWFLCPGILPRTSLPVAGILLVPYQSLSGIRLFANCSLFLLHH